MIDYNLIKILIAGILFGSLFIIKKKKIKTLIIIILTGYLLLLGAKLI